MSFLSGLSSKQPGRVLVINIGSATVTAAFVEHANEKPLVDALVSAPIAIIGDLSFQKFQIEMEKALSIALQKLLHTFTTLPESIVVYLGAPWYASQLRTAKMSRPSPFVITKSILGDVLTRELAAFESEVLATNAESGELVPIESKTLQVKLNGYPSADPVGVSARELDLLLFIAVAPKHTLDGIKSVIQHHYGHRSISFATFLLASYRIVQETFPSTSDYLLVDVGGEVTDVSLVRGGTLVQTVSFPRGRNFMIRRLSQGLNRSVDESITLCNLFIEGKMEDSTKEQCAAILKKVKDLWLQDFQKVLFSSSNEISIPDNVFLTSYADVAPWFVETIRREEFHQYSLNDKEFKVVVLDASQFHESLSFAEGVARDPFIMIEALAGRGVQ